MQRRGFRCFAKKLPFLILLTLAFFFWDKAQTLDEHTELTRKSLDSQIQAFGTVVKKAVGDTLSIASLLSQKTISEEQLKFLTGEFRRRMQLNPNYMQMRLLSADGQERIRLDNSPGGVMVTPKDQLQNKSHRYYFRHSYDLPAGSVYLSKLDLNIEHGEIERPLRPTYRIASPLRNLDDGLVGVLLINLSMRDLLAELTLSEQGAETMLISNDGFLKAGGMAAERWGDMILGRPQFARDNPLAWSKLAGQGRSVFQDNGALYVSQHLIPSVLFEPQFRGGRRLLTADESRWYLVNKIPLTTLLNKTLVDTTIFFIIMLVLLVSISWQQCHREILKEERKQAKRLAEKLGTMMARSSDLLMTTDSEDRIDYVNQAFLDTTGYEAHEVIGQNASELLLSNQHDQNFYDRLWADIHAGKDFHGLFINKKRDGSLYYEQKTISPMYDEEGVLTGYLSTGKDITDSHTLQSAFYDELTGLYNRAMLMERLSHALTITLRQKTGLAVFYVDLDGFKQLNTSHGHDAGDAVLKQAAAKLKALFRESDTVARIGGDEFVVLAESLTKDNVCELAEKCVKALQTDWHYGDVTLSGISASIGIALFTGDEEIEPAHVLEEADMAMYEVKQQGKSGYSIYGSGTGTSTATDIES